MLPADVGRAEGPTKDRPCRAEGSGNKETKRGPGASAGNVGSLWVEWDKRSSAHRATMTSNKVNDTIKLEESHLGWFVQIC